MKQETTNIDAELKSYILGFCSYVAAHSKIAAVALVDNYGKASDGPAIYEVLLVIRDFQPRLMSYIKTFKTKTITVFAIDQWIFERDIERGFLGEAVACKLIFPYFPFRGCEYLRECEVALEKRLILELLENLVFSFPELANRIQIEPQYFMYEVFSSRIRVFPLLAYNLADLKALLLDNETEALSAYNEALMQIASERKISISNGNITMSKAFITKCQDPRIRILNLAKNAPRTLFTAIFGVLPQLMNVVTQNTETFLRTQKINWAKQPDNTCQFIDPQKYVFFPTSHGLVSLADKLDIKGFAQTMLLQDQNLDIEVEPVGSMLNDVYLIRTYGNGNETKVLAKRFKDWSGFKWFPLTLWSFGARTFAVSGQARLAKECATSEYLSSEGFHVPKILHVSNAERLIFMEYIEGESLSQAIKRIANTTAEEKAAEELEKIRKVGEIYAQVHLHNVALGDTKPDNILIKADGSIYLIDFEQAAQDGDKSWDIAVFLYYCGHYLQPLYSNGKAEDIARAFIDGYLKAGGNATDVHKAGMPKYTRVFSIFTMPATILAISNVCKKA